jgi:Lipopolysaccharide kinase (Kdo/WaaP) family
MAIVEQDGWYLVVADEVALEPCLIRTLLASRENNGLPFRRSRHASTFLIGSHEGRPGADLFIKHFDPPTGWGRLKSCWRRARSAQTEHITAALRASGFSVPEILLHGIHRESRREILVTARSEGEIAAVVLRRLSECVETKRNILHALGIGIGRLHRAGFIHGDLTPYNIQVIVEQPPRFVFIDNERTRQNVVIARTRRRLRNLVQLGRFALPGITRSDRMRVFRAYEATLYGFHSRALVRRASAMLTKRLRRDVKRCP